MGLTNLHSQPASTGSSCAMSTALPSDEQPFTGRTFMLCDQNQEVIFAAIDDLNTGQLSL